MQEVEVEKDEDEYVFAVADEESGQGKVTVNIGGIPLGVIIDSGTSANVIDQTLWEELKKQHVKCVSKRSTKKLYAYGATHKSTGGYWNIYSRSQFSKQVCISRVHSHTRARRTTPW